MKMMNSLMLIDGNHLAHRAYHRFINFASIKGENSAVVYGGPFMVASLIRKFKPNKVIITFDTHPLAKERLDILPDYKQRESKIGFDKESFRNQLQDFATITSNLGVDIYKRPGEEADDIIYELCRKFPSHSKTIVSADKDFIPLLGPRIKMFNPSKGLIITTLNVEKEYNFTEKEFIDYLILKGDKSDNIPGVFGLGDVKIRNFLNEFESIENYLDGEPSHPWNKYPIREVYDTNRILINLKLFYSKFRKGRIIEPNIVGKWEPGKNESIYRNYSLTTFRDDKFLKPFETLHT